MPENISFPTKNPISGHTDWIELSKIDFPSNARVHSPEELDDLTQDIAKNHQLQEIVVSKQGDRYMVIAGVGRVLACRKLGWDKIRAQVKEGLSDFEKLHITYSENEARQDASPIYQAKLLNQMLEISGGITQLELGKRIGKTDTYMSDYLSLLKLDPEVQEKSAAADLSIRQLRQVKRLTDKAKQLALIEKISKENLSGQALEAHVDEQAPAKKSAAADSRKAPTQFRFTRKGNVISVKASVDLDKTFGSTFFQNFQDAYNQFLKESNEKKAKGKK